MKAVHVKNRGDKRGQRGQPVSMRVSGVPATGDTAGTSGDKPNPQILRIELLASYAHEIAHSAVALHYGCEVAVEISYDPATRYFDGVCHYRHPDGDLPTEAVRAIALGGIVGEAAYWLGWDSPRLTPDRLTESIRAGRVTVSPGDLLRAAGWQVEDMARAFGIVRNAWVWIVEEAENRALMDHGELFVPTCPHCISSSGDTGKPCAARVSPLSPLVPAKNRMNRND